MIALNELLKNLKVYENAYELMGLKPNLDVFVELEEKLRNTQLEYEHTRALCNKKCGELIKKNVAGCDTTEDLKEIKELDLEANRLQSKFEVVSKNINSKLKTLHNLPDNTNVNHLQIETTKTESDLNSLKKEIEKFCKVESSLMSQNMFIEEQAEKLINQTDLPLATYCQKGVVILCDANQIDELLSKLLDYFKQNSLSIIERSITKIKKSSSREFFIHLKHKLYLKLDVKREFYSRRYKIKYRDKQTDMTKFVNQINLIF